MNIILKNQGSALYYFNEYSCSWPKSLYPHPFLNFIHSKGMKCSFDNINSHGFYSDEYPTSRDSKTFKILVLGGSVAFQMMSKQVENGYPILKQYIEKNLITISITVISCKNGIFLFDRDYADYDLKFIPQKDSKNPHIKLFLIIDNSYSMIEEQSKLAEAMNQFVDELEGRDVRIALYNTTDFPRFPETSTSYKTFYLNYDNLGKPIYYLSAPQEKDHIMLDNFALVPPLNNSKELVITPNLTHKEFTQIKSNIITAIKKIGTSGTADEKAFCIISRILINDVFNASNDIDHTLYNTNDKVAFVLISDEDNTESTCTYSTEREMKADVQNTTRETTNPDEAVSTQYHQGFMQLMASYKYQEYKDNILIFSTS